MPKPNAPIHAQILWQRRSPYFWGSQDQATTNTLATTQLIILTQPGTNTAKYSGNGAAHNSGAARAKYPSSPSRLAPTFADFVFLDVDPTYDDAPPAYIVFEADDALVGTDAGASADDCSDVNDCASSRCNTPRAFYAASEPNTSASISDTTQRARFGRRLPRCQRSPVCIRGGDRVYAAADDFGTRGLYAAADVFDIRSGGRLYAPAGAFAVTTSESRPAPARKFARVNGAYVGCCLRRIFSK
ncbi:hypothetical protein B0H15DRAFT_797775 [Mycena belliarum]|uniref:Uncharacterized protein n=1 Tax=Mycena belliarum TaxID=1033014 RepID=A0AAD6UH77_9AGAR|nr:hypothetical protein B0H15DRAFT_797775 [Mycena belliae]